jgi:hypothetical protein
MLTKDKIDQLSGISGQLTDLANNAVTIDVARILLESVDHLKTAQVALLQEYSLELKDNNGTILVNNSNLTIEQVSAIKQLLGVN